MTSVELRQLNAYPEWKDNDMIQAVINYVQAVQNGNPFDDDIYTTQRQRHSTKVSRRSIKYSRTACVRVHLRVMNSIKFQ